MRLRKLRKSFNKNLSEYDSLLMELEHNGFLTITKDNGNKESLIRKLEQRGIIKKDESGVYRSTEKGIKVYNDYDSFQHYLDSEKQREKLEFQKLKGSVFQLKYWWVILLVNLLISLVLKFI